MLLKTVLLLITISAASAVRVNIRACPGGHRMPEWFESNDCTADRCTLRRNQVFSGRASVIPQTAFTQLNVGVDASLFGLAFPMPIPEGYESACDFLEGGARCPVTAGGNYVWALQFPLQSTLPAAQGVIIRLYAGEAGRRVACAEVTADIV